MKKDLEQLLEKKENEHKEFIKELRRLQGLFGQVQQEALKLEGEIRLLKELK